MTMQPERFGNSLVLFDRLATGGMGEVFRAKQIGTEGFEKTVAVKRIQPHIASRDDFAQLFRQEMWIAAKLQHSNIAQVFSNGFFADYLYLVMEFVQGKTLAEIISLCSVRNEFLGIKHICYICSEVAKGLHYAHTLHDDTTGSPLNIVHRDVTPQNIMCSENGEVKILDFGIAKVVDTISELSRIGDVKGKMQYVAPEQLDGKSASPQSDIFSLGVVMFELLTRRPLFLDESPFRTIQNVMTLEIPSLASFRDDIPEGLEEILRKALERDPAKRYSSAEEFHRHLGAFLNSHFPSYSSTELGKTVRVLAQSSKGPSADGAGPILTGKLQGFTRIFSPKKLQKGSSLLTRALGLVLSVALGLALAQIYLLYEDTRSPYRSAPPVAVFSAADAQRGADGTVSSWSSRGGFSFQQDRESSRPALVPNAIKGLPAVKFDGTDDFLLSTSVGKHLSSTNGATFIIVAKCNPRHIGYLFTLQQADMHHDVLRLGVDGNSHLRIKALTDPNQRLFFVSDTEISDQWAVYSLGAGPSWAAAYVNGQFVVGGPVTQPVEFGKSSIMSLGQEFDDRVGSDFFSGEIAEVYIFDRQIDHYYRNLFEEKLAAKYGISYAKPTP